MSFKKTPTPGELNSIYKCLNCELSKIHPPVHPRGNPDAKVVIIGEGPGVDEKKNDCFFTGVAGEKMQKVVKSVGLDLDKHFLCLNLINCWPPPPPDSKRYNGTPTTEQIKACRPNLIKQLEFYQPKLVILAGSLPLKSIMDPKLKISTSVGIIAGKKDHNLPIDADVAPIFHPSYILRNPDEEKNWGRDWMRIRDYILVRGLL